MIKKCTCAHEYQDRKYGKGNRVWNPTLKGIRCTVCATLFTDERYKEITSKRKEKK